MTEPPAPEGTRLVRADGTELPLELVYLGFYSAAHQWEAVVAFTLADDDAVTVDRLPPHTAITLRFTHITPSHHHGP